MKLYFDTTENKAISLLPETRFYPVKADFQDFCNDLKYQEDDIFIINAEMKYGENQKYTDFSGIRLLKWLRIHKKLTNKIIVYGLLPLKSIIELHPEHIILMARGTSYIQFPFSENEFMQTIHTTEQIEKGKLVEYYKPFVKADFNIEQIGHSFANEFGLHLMQIMHNYISDTPLTLNVKSTYSTLDFDKAFFLYSRSGSPNILEQIGTTKDDLINIIREQESKILYIDDQATLGWDMLLYDMIFGSESNSGFVVLSNAGQFGESNVFRTINREKPRCVLLDLRLKGDIEKDLQIEEISGYKLLLAIKNKFPSLPVIILSATNKADNLRALTKARAEGLWTKPRIEFIHNNSYFSDSYLNLLQLVYKALTKYKTLLGRTIFKLNFQEIQPKPFDSADDFFSKSKFIFDTNYFICSNNHYESYYNRLYYFILLCDNIKRAGKKKRIIISQDVLMELFILSTKRYPKTFDVRLSSKYALDLIFRISNTGSDVIETNFALESQLKNANISYNISKGNPSDRFRLSKRKTEFVDFFVSRKEAKENIEVLKKKDKQDILHADDTLKLLANYYFIKENQDVINNIYFINDDLVCNYNVVSFIRRKNSRINFKNINYKVMISEKDRKLRRAEFSYTKGTTTRNIFIYRGTKFIDEFKKKIE